MRILSSSTLTKFTSILSIVLLTACGGTGPASIPAPSPPPPLSGIPSLSSVPTDLGKIATIGFITWPNGDTPSGGQGGNITGFSCAMMEGDVYHVHAHLTIIKNGQTLAIPAGIGIVSNTCLYALHTHNANGEIHIEAFAKQRFTLGQFFAIWGQTLTNMDVAGMNSFPIVVYLVDDTIVTKYIGDLNDIELTSHRSVVIQIGSQIGEIPTYIWDTVM